MYIRTTGVLAKLSLTSCQMWLVALKLVERDSLRQNMLPIKLYDAGIIWCWGTASVKLNNNIISLCLRKSGEWANATNGGWYLVTAKKNTTLSAKIIGRNGVGFVKTKHGFKTMISARCRIKFNTQIINSTPNTPRVFYCCIGGGIKLGKWIETLIAIKQTGLLIVGAKSITTPYWSRDWTSSCIIKECVNMLRKNHRSHKECSLDLLSQAYWNMKTLNQSIQLERFSSIGAWSAICQYWPERLRRVYELQNICRNSQLRSRRISLIWSRSIQ